MAQFRRAMLFITEMATQQITKLTILNFSPAVIILANTTREYQRQLNDLTLSESAPWRRAGIARKRGENGIVNTLKKCMKTVSQQSGYVKTVGQAILLNGAAAWTGFAPMLASLLGGAKAAWMTLRSRVDIAARHLLPINMLTGSIVPASVVQTQDKETKQAVFNLTVADTHEYFANSILVSNCDGERYIVGYIRPGESLVSSQTAQKTQERLTAPSRWTARTTPRWRRSR